MSRSTVNNARAAFTLIEVLIGIMILALGLLGLGAVIPVVVSEQRRAMEAQLGLEAAKAARSYLTSRPDLDPATPHNFIGNTAQRTIGWDVWLMEKQKWSPPIVGNPVVDCYLWMPWNVVTNLPQEMVITNTGSTPNWASVPGDFGWHLTTATPQVHCTIPLADRLWPGESVQAADTVRLGYDPHRPLFVWDFIGRRVQTRAGQPEQLQVAIFVRRLDLNIRVPRKLHTGSNPAQQYTLRDVVLDRLNGSPGDQEAAVPTCSYSSTAGAQAYLPTNTGVIPGSPSALQYSEIISLGDQNQNSGVTVVFNPSRSSNWLELQGLTVTNNRWKLVSQPGQKIVDNLGNVYTVRGALEDVDPAGYQQFFAGNPILVIDPPVPAYVPASSAVLPNSPGSLRQIIFTPQIPAAIEVFTVTRTQP